MTLNGHFGALVILSFIIRSCYSSICIGDVEGTWRYCDDNQRNTLSCQCHNIHLNGLGDGDCKSTKNGTSWCYVIGASSNCTDKIWTDSNKKFSGFVKDHRTIYKSHEACEGNANQEGVGNDPFLPGYELTCSNSSFFIGGGGFFTPTPEACETECYERQEVCDAWTFIISPKNESENMCYLKEACCFKQQSYIRENSLAMSGFLCIKDRSVFCWSTHEAKNSLCRDEFAFYDDGDEITFFGEKVNPAGEEDYYFEEYSDYYDGQGEISPDKNPPGEDLSPGEISGEQGEISMAGEDIGLDTTMSPQSEDNVAVGLGLNVDGEDISDGETTTFSPEGDENGDYYYGKVNFDSQVHHAAVGDVQTYLAASSGVGRTNRPGRYFRLLYKFVNGRWRRIKNYDKTDENERNEEDSLEVTTIHNA